MNWAKQVSNKTLRFFGSPWSSPTWMKSSNAFNGQGYLLPEYYQVWADYFVRYIPSHFRFKMCVHHLIQFIQFL